MSPRSVVEEVVHGSEGDATVRVEGDVINVAWSCGESRSFQTDRLKDVFYNVEELAVKRGLVALLRDSNGEEFALKVSPRDGKVSAASHPGEWAAATVPWDHLKAAMEDAAKTHEKLSQSAGKSAGG